MKTGRKPNACLENGFFINRLEDLSMLNPDHSNIQNHSKIYTVSVYVFQIPPSSGALNSTAQKVYLSFSLPNPENTSDYSEGGIKAFYIFFTQEFLLSNKSLFELAFNLPMLQISKLQNSSVQLSNSLAEVLIQTFQEIYAEFHSENHDKFELITSYVYSLLLLIKRQSNLTIPIESREAHRSMHNAVFNKFTSLLVKNNLATPEDTKNCRSVTYFAKQLYVHPNHLNSIVKKETGHTAQDLIFGRVIHFSKMLLLQTDLSIKEIAERLSFTDSSHFSTFFKKRTNLSPSQFRQN